MNIEALRADTPAAAHVIHFNNAGAALMPNPVYDAVTGHLDLERRIGGYEAAAAAADALDDFYPALADLLGCHREEIAYVENATRAWDMAFYGIAFRPGDVIVTAEAEYASNYIALLHMAKLKGVAIEIVPSNGHGEIDLEALEAVLRRGGVKLISLTHVPTQSGLVNPAEEVGQLARKYAVLYLLDACQSVGQMPVDVRRIGCHMLSGTGRKFLRGPRGTGFLYVARDVLDRLEPPFLDLHAASLNERGAYDMLPDARRFENWECFVAGRLGLRAAVRYALEVGVDDMHARITALADRLRSKLASVPGAIVRDPGRRRCGIVTFTIEGQHPDETKRRLAAHGINVSVSRARYAALDLGKRGLPAVVRASVHAYNLEAEVDHLIDVLHRPM